MRPTIIQPDVIDRPAGNGNLPGEPVIVRAVPDAEYVEPDWHRALVRRVLPGRK